MELTEIKRTNIAPPLGLKPRHTHERERMQDIADAMDRYLEAGMEIPKEWIEEYDFLASR